MRAVLRSKESVVFALFAAVFAVFALRTPNFATPDNLFNVARQYSELAVVSVGLTMIIITGGIDISVGSIVGLSSVMLGIFALRLGLNIWASCILATMTGLACGLINGVFITKLKVQPIVVTLAMMSAARGLALALTQGFSHSGFPDAFVGLGQTSIGSMPLSVPIALLIVIIGVIVLRRTPLGRGIYAVGSSEEATRLSGMDTFRLKMFAYGGTGLLCGLAGIMMAARLASAVPDAGNGFEFEAITAVVLGGSSLKGGEGSIVGTIIGVAVMAILRNGLNLIGVPDNWQVLFLGVALILSVLADNLRQALRKRRETRPQNIPGHP